MGDLSHFFALASAWIIFIVTPGPSFAIAVHYATARSRAAGILVGFGVTCALCVWLVGSMLGLNVLFTHFILIAQTIKILGTCYLFYLGIQTIRHAQQADSQISPSLAMRREGPSFFAGFITTIGNPKAVAFFSSLFALFLPINLTIWVQGTTVVLLLLFVIVWFSLVSCVLSFGPICEAYLRAKCWVERSLGGIFVILGLMLLIEH